MPNHTLPHRSPLTALTRTAVCALVAGAALLVPAISRADTGCATASMSASSQPACWLPFSSSSPFNTALPAAPVLASDNAAVQQHMATYGWSLDGSSDGFTLSGDGTRPVYFASSSDPVMTVDCTDEDGPGTCQGANNIDVNGARINVPAGAVPDSNTDAHMTVIETATDTEYDFWHVSISGSTLTAGAGAEVNVGTGNGIGSAGDAADFALTAGLLRPSELLSGQIDHALVITVPCTNAQGANVGYTYPASGGWGEFCGEYWSESATTAPMLGQRYQLDMTDAQIAASGAPVWEQTIMTALAHYGAYIEDTNGSWRGNNPMNILTQDPNSWTSIGQANQWASVISQLGGSNSTLSSSVAIPASMLRLVDTCVTQGTCLDQTGTPLGGSAPPSPPPTSSSPVPPPTVSTPVTPPTVSTPVTPPTSTSTTTSSTSTTTSTTSTGGSGKATGTTSSSRGSAPPRRAPAKRHPRAKRNRKHSARARDRRAAELRRAKLRRSKSSARTRAARRQRATS